MAARNLGFLGTLTPVDPSVLAIAPIPKVEEHRHKTPGHVYVIFCPQSFLFKIGATQDLVKRLKNFETQNSVPIRLFHRIPSADIFREEGFIHSILASRLDHGEWFRLGWADLAALKKYRSRV